MDGLVSFRCPPFGQIGEGFSLIIQITIDMNKYYITADKVGEFIQRMYEKGIRVDAEPGDAQLAVHKPDGGYEWIKVFSKGSFEELCSAFIPNEEK
jgi:hypothetical protein